MSMVTKHGQHLAKLSLRNLVKSYGPAAAAVQGINLDVADREFVVLVGPSGCGKSTTLRMIAGLEYGRRPARSALPISSSTRCRRGERDIAMVFQNYALYPHLTVFAEHRIRARAQENAAARDPSAASSEASRILGLDGLLER